MKKNILKLLKKNMQITIAGVVFLAIYVIGYVFDSPIALFVLFLYGIFLISSHFEKRVNQGTLFKLEILAKVTTIIASIIFLLFSTSQLNFGGGRQAGAMFIMFCIVILFPYIIVVIVLNFSKNKTLVINLFIGLFFILTLFGLRNPALGALISFSFPLVIYIAIYLKKLKKLKFITFGVATLYLISTPYYFIQGTDIGLRLKDPCFKRERYGKGETHYIKGDRVCAFIYQNSWDGYYSTVAGADAETYESISAWYTKDKNSVYYGHKKIDADTSTFKYENHIFSDKNGIWEEGKLSAK